MTKEKTKISRRRKISFILLIITVVLLLCVRVKAIDSVKIVNYSMKTAYYDYDNELHCTLNLELNTEIYSGKATVGLYDTHDNLLQEVTGK